LLYTAPFAIWAFALPLLKGRRPDTQHDPGISEGQSRSFPKWIYLMLGGVVLLASGVLLTYYWAAERFLGDVMPTLMLLSTLGFWAGYGRVTGGAIRQKLYVGPGVAVAAISIAASTLIAISVNNARLHIIEQISNAR